VQKQKKLKKQMSNTKLFKDAIADAKALREVAVANAKAALEESFAPRIQSMFEKRVMEAEELDEKKEDELDEKVTYEYDKPLSLVNSIDENEDIEEGYGAYEYEKGKNSMKEEDLDEEDIDLEELFNSLSEEDYGGNKHDFKRRDGHKIGDVDGHYKDYEMNEDDDEDYDLDEILAELEADDNLEEGDDEDINENTMFEKATGDEEISEVTVDELRDMIQDAIKAALGDAEGGEEEMDMDLDMDMGGEEGDDEDFDLDIDTEEETEEKPKKSKKDELDEIRALYEKKKGEIKKELDERKRYKMNPKMEEKKEDLEEGKDLNAPFGKGGAKSKPGAPYGAAGPKKAGKNGAYSHSLKMKLNEKDEVDEAKDKEKELEEAINVIKALRSQLNEVNLLNAKLIYVNKIFKANSLNEGQKVKVVNSFDKAKTLNEAKNIYEVLKDNIATAKTNKAPLRESKQIASTIIGGKTASQPIVADDMITRMQRLAGIIKD